MTQPIEPVEVAYVTQANGTYMDTPQVIVNLDANDTARTIKAGDHLYTASALEAAKQEGRREGLEEARRAVLHEVLHLEDVNCKEDVAYNSAINDAQNAIRALIERKP